MTFFRMFWVFFLTLIILVVLFHLFLFFTSLEWFCIWPHSLFWTAYTSFYFGSIFNGSSSNDFKYTLNITQQLFFFSQNFSLTYMKPRLCMFVSKNLTVYKSQMQFHIFATWWITVFCFVFFILLCVLLVVGDSARAM